MSIPQTISINSISRQTNVLGETSLGLKSKYIPFSCRLVLVIWCCLSITSRVLTFSVTVLSISSHVRSLRRLWSRWCEYPFFSLYAWVYLCSNFEPPSYPILYSRSYLGHSRTIGCTLRNHGSHARQSRRQLARYPRFILVTCTRNRNSCQCCLWSVRVHGFVQWYE